MKRPEAGDIVEMPVMESDVAIEVRRLPADQPRLADGVWTIEDQYGDHHLVEYDGDTLVTVNPDFL